MTRRVAVFSPFANIWEHSYPEALLSAGLRETGWDVTFLRCDGAFAVHCVAMSASSVNEFASEKTRSAVCGACRKRRDFVDREFDFASSILESFIDADLAAQIDAIVDEATPQSWTNVEVDGVPLGRFAAYEMWLNNKLVSTALPDELWPVYLGQLRNTVSAYLAGLAFLDDNQPEAVYVYNDHYSVNHGFVAAANKRGTPAYSIHAGWHMVRRAESMSMMKSDYTMADIFRSTGWKRFREKPLSSEKVALVAEHFDGLWEGSSAFAYSSGLEGTSATALREKLGIDSTKKVLLAAMSSEDELMGVQLIGIDPKSESQVSLFADQFEWVAHLMKFAAAHPETHIVLRLHPRMFPNKRELKLSPVVDGIMRLRESAPSNVTFNVPADNIGIYDLVQIVDVLLNFRSSVGAELMAMGIPVVVPANASFYTYPDELNRVGHTTDEYDTLILEAVNDGWSIENARRAFRWFGFLFSRVAVGFSESVSSRPIAARPKKPGVKLWLWKKMVYLVIHYGPLVRERLAMRRKSLPPSATALFADVLDSKLDSVSDSKLWPNSVATLSQESADLEEFFSHVLESKWAAVTESDSLAGRVRASVPPTQPK
jgi:hypothetical protein